MRGRELKLMKVYGTNFRAMSPAMRGRELKPLVVQARKVQPEVARHARA